MPKLIKECTCQESALAYLKIGWKPLPLQPRNKAPIPDNWTKIHIDEERIHHWWTKWPNANIGILTGSKSGIVVLDLDGDFSFDPKIHPIPPTPTSRSGSGGQHYFFRHPAFTVKGLRRVVHSKAGGLDILGDGQQVVVPPSLHPNCFTDSTPPAIWQLSSD